MVLGNHIGFESYNDYRVFESYNGYQVRVPDIFSLLVSVKADKRKKYQTDGKGIFFLFRLPRKREGIC